MAFALTLDRGVAVDYSPFAARQSTLVRRFVRTDIYQRQEIDVQGTTVAMTAMI